MEIIRDIIKEGSINRPGAKNSCQSITIHETANKRRGANARAHAEYVKSLKERTSWHYTVDDREIRQHLPDGEKSYHTASAQANESSISIELCVNEDGDFEKTKDNAEVLIKSLMKTYSIPPERIFTHKDWTGKNCPATLLRVGLSEFLSRFSEKEKTISVSELLRMGYGKIELT